MTEEGKLPKLRQHLDQKAITILDICKTQTDRWQQVLVEKTKSREIAEKEQEQQYVRLCEVFFLLDEMVVELENLKQNLPAPKFNWEIHEQKGFKEAVDKVVEALK